MIKEEENHLHHNKHSMNDIEAQKLLQEKLMDLTNEKIPPKKTIVVIGPMGHGKSSFIKMLVSEQDGKKIMISAKTESATKQCSLYEISTQAKKKLNIQDSQKVYIMDTPGLDSQSKSYIVMENIKAKILLEKCEIISILFIRSMTTSRQNISYDSKIMYSIFPLPRKIKDKITYFVLTNFDSKIYEGKANQQFLESLDKEYKKIGVNFLLQKHIKWMSYPKHQQDIKEFKQRLSGDKKLRQAYSNQWNNLSSILKGRNQHKCTLKQIHESSQKFRDSIKLKLQKILLQQKQTVQDKIKFDFQTKYDGIVSEVFLGIGLGGITFGYGGLIGLLIYQSITAIAMTSAMLLGCFFLPAVLGIYFGLGSLVPLQKKGSQRVKQAVSQFKNLKDKFRNQDQLKLEAMILNFLKICCLQQLKMENSSGSLMKFTIDSWIQKIEIKEQDIGNKKSQLKKYYERIQKIDGKDIKYGQLRLGKLKKYTFEITYRRPTQHSLVQLIKQAAQEVYGQ